MNTLPPRLIKITDNDYIDANSVIAVWPSKITIPHPFHGTTIDEVHMVQVMLRGMDDATKHLCGSAEEARALADRIAAEVNIFSVKEVVPDKQVGIKCKTGLNEMPLSIAIPVSYPQWSNMTCNERMKAMDEFRRATRDRGVNKVTSQFFKEIAKSETFDHNDPDWQRDQSLTCPCQFCRGPEISKALEGTQYENCIQRGEFRYDMRERQDRTPIFKDVNELLKPLGFVLVGISVDGSRSSAKVVPIPQ